MAGTLPPQGEFAPIVPPPEPPMVYGITPSSGPAPSPVAQPTSPTVPENPFVPQGVVPKSSPPVPKQGGGGLRRVVMILVFLVILGGLVVLGRFAWGFVASQQEQTITYWGLWEDERILQSAITAFTAGHPKIKVTYVKQSPKQYRERLQSAIARGEGPDVFRFHNTWVPMIYRDLATVPATVMTPQQFATTFYPVASRNLVSGQNIYGIPLEIDGLGLYYNEDLLASAGVSVPTTYEELLNVAPKLTVKNENTIVSSAIALGTTNNVEHFSDIVAAMMLQNGVALTNPQGKEAEDSLIFYRKFADPSDPVYTWNETLDNSIVAFANGKVAMILAPSWRAFDIKQMNPSLRFKIAPMPTLPGSTVTWASYWVEGVSNKSKNLKAAWAFVNYLTSREGAMNVYSEASKTRLFGEPYARVQLGESLQDDPYAGAFIKQAAQDGQSFPLASRTFDNGINDKLIKYLEDAINGLAGGAAPSGVLPTMAEGFGQVLTTYGLSSGSLTNPSAKP